MTLAEELARLGFAGPGHAALADRPTMDKVPQLDEAVAVAADSTLGADMLLLEEPLRLDGKVGLGWAGRS